MEKAEEHARTKKLPQEIRTRNVLKNIYPRGTACVNSGTGGRPASERVERTSIFFNIFLSHSWRDSKNGKSRKGDGRGALALQRTAQPAPQQALPSCLALRGKMKI